MTFVIKADTIPLYKRLFPVAKVGVSGMGRNAQGVCMASALQNLSDSHVMRTL